MARHAGTDQAELALEVHDGRVGLIVSDRGGGLRVDQVEGAGMRGMRRGAPATLIGGDLQIEAGP